MDTKEMARSSQMVGNINDLDTTFSLGIDDAPEMSARNIPRFISKKNVMYSESVIHCLFAR